MRRAGLASCVVLLVAGSGACSSFQDCTAIGMASAVGVDVPVGWVVNELCIDGACQTPIEPPQQSVPDQTPPWQIYDDPATYSYRLSVTAPDASSVVRDGVVATEEYRVNGPGCGPVTANATLVLDDAGVVTVRHP